MFISQVIFEGDRENEQQLKDILRKKLSATDVPGLIAAECWRSEKSDSVSYALVNRWQSKAHFKAWMAVEHAGRGARSEGDRPDKPAIAKTGFQFEVVEMAALSE